ncbi:MAG: bacillithiol biosynthesis deacetylase BshB1 [Planctomycetes bacterium]|nr:bacillithiol biosynthesis deacetylase BshB1 [Planctomycetota bacterium]MBI3848265.1 bacillithiol biosynthesis deacetylase BshB1 [Planctomycetota bacterium]
MSLPDPADALVFGAHPDDIEMGCGGLIRSLVRRGRRVVVVDCTRGELSTRGTVESRRAETDAASRILGIVARENLELPDGSVPDGGSARSGVVAAIRKWRPQLLVAPPTRDLHPDHARAGSLVVESHFLAGVAKFPPDAIDRLPPHRANQVIHFMQHWRFVPSFVVDITDMFGEKMAAIRCYGSQFFKGESDESPTNLARKEFLDELEARDRYYGTAIGVRYGEPYWVEGPVRVADPVAAWPDAVPPTGKSKS